MSIETCTVHQRLTPDGIPMVQGSEVRLPDGTPIPGISSVHIEAIPGNGGLWVTTITLHAVFGDPLRDEAVGGDDSI